jgi:hypothetical protein
MDEKKFEESTVQTSSPEHLPAYGDSHVTKGSLGQRFIDSFKRDPMPTLRAAMSRVLMDLDLISRALLLTQLRRPCSVG